MAPDASVSASDDSVVQSKPNGTRTIDNGSRISNTEDTEATDLLKVQSSLLQDSNLNAMNVKENMHSDSKHEILEGSTEHSGDVATVAPPGPGQGSTEKNDDMELETPVNETDDSDMVEQDVKVCDICGDAGREDLLAICCQCSDGAEHTYCMREMLAKVPEGEWLCEECKNAERVSNGRREKVGRMDETEKNNSSGQASSDHVNSSDVEGQKLKGFMKMPSKRHRDEADTEVSSVAKKPTLDSRVGSPKASNSSKSATISRENSSKHLVKGRLQTSHHSSGTGQVNDAAEPSNSTSDVRANNFRGTFSKSNSFNSLNSKAKVKLVDQVAIQRQKSVREHGSFRLKEGAVRSIGKSMSFKSTSTFQSETRMKMISPRLSDNTQDIKNVKQRSPFELQRNPSINSTKGNAVSPTSRIDKRPLSRAESSVTSIANHHEMKPAQVEGKAAPLSRLFSLAGRRTLDLSSSSGDMKRPLMLTPSNLGGSSTNGVNNIEKRSNQATLKDEMSSSILAERPTVTANESSGNRSIPPSIKPSRDESDNLKAAIEAAVLKKPGVYRKHRAVGPPHDSSVSSFAGKKKLSADADQLDKPTVSCSLNANSSMKELPGNVKHSSLVYGEVALPSGGRKDIHVGSCHRDTISDVSATVPMLLKSLALPEHEHIWQGCFEIYCDGKLFDSWDGIQAHVSTCASPKVVEAANKFKNRIVLYEVPRLSTWPTHFQENGVTEENIALFFFARDLESYDKIYKVLVDNMMKNDLALKGNVNGVELLIFPSNQLPDNSQRWNMLFFLWGVFRGKKENCLQYMPESFKQFGPPRDIPPPIMSLPDNRCSQKPVAEDSLATEDAAPMLSAAPSEKLESLLSSKPVNGDFEVSFLDRVDDSLNSSSSAALQSDARNKCPGMKTLGQEGGIIPSSDAFLATESSGREQVPMQLDSPLDKLQSSHHSRESNAGNIENNVGSGTILERTCMQNTKLTVDTRDPSGDRKTSLKNDWFTRDLNKAPEECMFSESDDVVPEQYAGASTLSTRSHEVCSALDKVTYIPLGSDSLQGRHLESGVNTLISERIDNAERRFFPIESQPRKCGPFWKMDLLETGQPSDLTPNLELALGAEKCSRTPDIQLPLVNKVDQKVNEEHMLKNEAGSKAEDDISAALSLSLSFPFPEKEVGTEPAPKIGNGRLMSERDRLNTSMLLFGDLGDN